MGFHVEVVEKEKGVFVVLPQGHLDSNTYLGMEEEVDRLLNESTRVIIFDMADLEYISSAGLRILFKAMKTMKTQGGTTMVSNLQPQIKKVFEIIDALPSFNIFRDMEEVDQYLDVMQKKELEKNRP